MTGLVSVVMPTYNYGRFVCDGVDSVLGQTYPGPVELIVVDDGSTDDTEERLRAYGDRIRYVKKANGGVSSARNAGLRLARGEWVGLLDADDMWHPQLLEILLGIAERDGWDVVSSHLVKDRALLDAPLPEVHTLEQVTVRQQLTFSKMSSSGSIVRRRCFEAVGYYDERLHAAEDKLLWLRLAARYRVASVHSKLHYYRQHPAQATQGKAERAMGHYRAMLDTFFALQPEYEALRPMAEGYMYWDAAVAYLDEGNRKDALRNVVRSLGRKPWVPGTGRFSSATRLKVLVRLLAGERVFRLVQRS